MLPFPPAALPPARGAEKPGSTPAAKKKPAGPMRPPPGISGTVAALVISPDWFAAKEANQRPKHWWSPSKLLQSSRAFVLQDREHFDNIIHTKLKNVGSISNVQIYPFINML